MLANLKFGSSSFTFIRKDRFIPKIPINSVRNDSAIQSDLLVNETHF